MAKAHIAKDAKKISRKLLQYFQKRRGYVLGALVLSAILLTIFSVQFSKNSAKVVINCDAYFSSLKSGSTETRLPFACSEDIGYGTDVVVRVNTGGTLTVSDSTGHQILKVGPSNVLPKGFVFQGSKGVPLLEPEAFSFADVTYDGYKDIVLLSNAGAYNYTYDYLPYNSKIKKFEPEPVASATNPEIDPSARTITSFVKDRGIGDMFRQETMRYTKGGYFLAKLVMQMAVNIGDLNAGYTLTTQEYDAAGKVTVSTKKHLTKEEVMGTKNQ